MIELQPGKYRRSIKRVWLFTLLGPGLFVFYIVAVSYNFFWLFGGMPDLITLENPKSELASELISEDGKSLGKYFFENRTPVEFDQISSKVTDALIATEDARFINHSGIDPRSMLRVAKGILLASSSSGGGSTLTQQVAKNLFETRSEKYKGLLGKIPFVRTVIAKTKEWILSITLERKYTKKEIMMMYLNTVSFGNNTFGIKVAAKTYFNKEPLDLEVNEAALLVGMLQNPTLYNPLRFPTNATNRRNTVLAQMVKYNYLPEDQFDTYKEKDLGLKFTVDGHNTGPAPYFRESMRGYMRDWVRHYNEENGTDLDLYTSGLRIYTTIDSRMQAYQEEALNEHMKTQQRLFDAHWKGRNPWADANGKEIPGFIEKAVRALPYFNVLKREVGEEEAWKVMRRPYKMKVFAYDGEKEMTMSPMDSIRYYKRFLHAGMMSMDPRSGEIKAWVGGVNFKYFKYDHVKQGARQPGSTFKPFVYVAALYKNFLTPCDKIVDGPVEGQWTPKNSNGKYSELPLTLRQALGKSVNSVSAAIIQMVKPETVVEYAHKLGITSKLDAVPSLCLGVSSVSVYEMVNAYCAFANGGYRTEPLTILRIEDRYGNVLQEFHQKQNQELSANVAYNMLYLMRGAVEDPGGTAGRLHSYGVTSGNEIAAKTGTTDNQSDSWFMGMTQNLVSGIWVGGEDMSIHFRTIDLGQGGRAAMPAWGIYMKKVYEDQTLVQYRKGPFVKPENYVLDCGNVASDSTDTYVPPASSSDDEGVLF
ncbi:transglycosylase domain-containing protein [Dyadobacter sp. LHD-138]|uniref:penicillin-binding protein 1A n=1 Tax=Dyadobacter sp. LHD-138 TaxID=3071413 RepID=UPI0027E210B6|nr:transglycosylase domain-containing protein [Dyadobacter sp. LHD-138]MDQ6480833.1 transglycosylase domain-containing protein [Dyadobacter sp. LHD-138]